MPTTSNFGWTTPADTDLVKDGAAAIRTLGNGIDTSLVGLKGGTTGQILSKTSNTDLAYTWINNDQGDITAVTAGTGLTGGGTTGAVTLALDSTAVIAPTIVDAKGDIIAGTANDTVTRLAVGTNGQVLTADSAETTGLKWTTPAGAYNPSYSLIGSVALSGATSRTVTGISGKTDLLVIVQSASTSGATDSIRWRINSDSGANYYYNGSYATNTGSSLNWDTWNTSAGTFVWFASQATASSTINGYIKIEGCNSSGLKTFNFLGSGTAGTATERFNAGGYWNNTSTVSSIYIESNGSAFDGGTMYVYGA